MVKFLMDLIIREDLKKLYTLNFVDKVKYVWRKGWNETPEFMIFIGPVVVATIVNVFVLREQHRTQKLLPRYFNDVTILRPNSHLFPKIRTDDRLSIERPIW